jgi:peptide-methionine (S)-S-oxide reductase
MPRQSRGLKRAPGNVEDLSRAPLPLVPVTRGGSHLYVSAALAGRHRRAGVNDNMRNILIAVLALILSPTAFAKTEQAVFAGGCFWCMETDMQAVPGVIEVMSGYTGGALKNPTYQDVLTERTGHYEAVRVTYDSDKITYEQLLSKYWLLVDPTDAGGQFCDRGPSYRSAIFVMADQKEVADASKQKLDKSGKLRKPVVTQVLPLGDFWPAEDYHRNFAKKNSESYHAYRTGCGREATLKNVWKAN